MIRIFGIPNCDSCRKAIKWLENHDADYEFINIREGGLTNALLRRWQNHLGWEPLINRRSATWRQIPEKHRDDLDAGTARQLILRHPTVMKRPLLDDGSAILLGFDERAYAKIRL